MEVLGGIRRLANLKVIPRRQLQKTLDARAGMLWPLAFIAVWQQQNHAGEQSPLVLARADELIDHRLRDVDEVAELRLPKHESLRIIAAVAVFESQHAGFRQRGIVDLAASLPFRNVLQRHVFLLVLDIKEHGVALIEGATASILSAEPDRHAGFHQAAKRQSL